MANCGTQQALFLKTSITKEFQPSAPIGGFLCSEQPQAAQQVFSQRAFILLLSILNKDIYTFHVRDQEAGLGHEFTPALLNLQLFEVWMY